MSKRVTQKFICEACGYRSPKWLGRCPSCTAWDSMSECRERVRPFPGSGNRLDAPDGAQPYEQLSLESTRRTVSGVAELDRTLGGGFVPGMLVLLGGEPGVGKSTLALQCAAALGSRNDPALYVTAEESKAQLRLRGERLDLKPRHLLVLSENDLTFIGEEIERLSPAFVVVDSIQAVASSELPASAGSVVQIRECALRFLALAKARAVPILLVGHITKDGALAGPKLLEHMVDTVLTFEGDSDHAHRMLRCTKNRFGPADEVGIFTMTQSGLEGLLNPSEWFLRDRQAGTAGSAVTVHREGSRTFLVEVQALAGRPAHGSPQRTAVGIDTTRLSLIAAVLERHAGLPLTSLDLFANAAGGVRLQDPGADLALAVALASAVTQQGLEPGTAFLGEVGLGGEVRSVPRLEERVREAARCGFSRVVLPQRDSGLAREAGLQVTAVPSVAQAFEALFDLNPGTLVPSHNTRSARPQRSHRLHLKGGPPNHA